MIAFLDLLPDALLVGVCAGLVYLALRFRIRIEKKPTVRIPPDIREWRVDSQRRDQLRAITKERDRG